MKKINRFNKHVMAVNMDTKTCEEIVEPFTNQDRKRIRWTSVILIVVLIVTWLIFILSCVELVDIMTKTLPSPPKTWTEPKYSNSLLLVTACSLMLGFIFSFFYLVTSFSYIWSLTRLDPKEKIVRLAPKQDMKDESEKKE